MDDMIFKQFMIVVLFFTLAYLINNIIINKSSNNNYNLENSRTLDSNNDDNINKKIYQDYEKYNENNNENNNNIINNTKKQSKITYNVGDKIVKTSKMDTTVDDICYKNNSNLKNTNPNCMVCSVQKGINKNNNTNINSVCLYDENKNINYEKCQMLCENK
jgi:hypothetical protein